MRAGIAAKMQSTGSATMSGANASFMRGDLRVRQAASPAKRLGSGKALSTRVVSASPATGAFYVRGSVAAKFG